MISLLTACSLAVLASFTEIKSDEQIVFFPTTAWHDPQSATWQVPIHGWIFEPELNSLRRNAALATLRIAFELDESADDSELFQARARWFLVDNERGKRITIRIGEQTYTLTASDRDGHCFAKLTLDEKTVAAMRQSDTTDAVPPNQVVSFAAVLSADDPRQFVGRVQFVDPKGLSVVSDIDDTIKISHVRDKPRLLEQTFLKPFEATPGMVDAYRRLTSCGATFHYVSGSPWQLYPPLTAFNDEVGYPFGSWHMKRFRPKDQTITNLLGDQVAYKLAAIEPLFKAWPQRQFVLIGDTGEKDPEVYGELARKYPQQIKHIWLRDVTAEPSSAERYQQALRDVPGDKWQLIDDGAQIEP